MNFEKINVKLLHYREGALFVKFICFWKFNIYFAGGTPSLFILLFFALLMLNPYLLYLSKVSFTSFPQGFIKSGVHLPVALALGKSIEQVSSLSESDQLA